LRQRGRFERYGRKPFRRRAREWIGEFYDEITGRRTLKERLEAELLRTANTGGYPAAVHVEKVRSPRSARPVVRLGGVGWLEWESEYLGVARRLTWEGDAEAALEILRLLPDRVGAGAFWGAFRGDLAEARLWAEVDRVIGTPHGVDFGVSEDGSIRLDHAVWPSWRRWDGAAEEAHRRIAKLADRVGTDAFWAVFPDARDVPWPDS
jgi:hypothetical protein